MVAEEESEIGGNIVFTQKLYIILSGRNIPMLSQNFPIGFWVLIKYRSSILEQWNVFLRMQTFN